MRPHTSYIILATPRSGSYLLCEALINTQLAGNPTEYFGPMRTQPLKKHWGISNYAEYLARIIEEGTTSNGVFGAKIIWQFFEYFIDHLREVAGYEKLPIPQLLATVFPNLHYIWITRRDKVRQAVSHSKALQTNAWLGIHGSQPPPEMLAGWEERLASNPAKSQRLRPFTKELVFNFKTIERLRLDIEQDEREIQQYFTACGVQPFKVVYEDLVEAYEETALQILDYLHIPMPEHLVFGERQLRKQANEQSEEWVQRYHQLKEQEDEARTYTKGI